MAPSHVDVVLSILGASAGLGGLVLVFLGLVISAYQAYPGDTPQSVRDRARRAGWPILAVFILSVVSVAMALTWLIVPGGDCLYWATVVVFFADLAVMVGVAAQTTFRLLR